MRHYLTLLAHELQLPDSLTQLVLDYWDQDLLNRCFKYSNDKYLQELAIYSWLNYTFLDRVPKSHTGQDVQTFQTLSSPWAHTIPQMKQI